MPQSALFLNAIRQPGLLGNVGMVLHLLVCRHDSWNADNCCGDTTNNTHNVLCAETFFCCGTLGGRLRWNSNLCRIHRGLCAGRPCGIVFFGSLVGFTVGVSVGSFVGETVGATLGILVVAFLLGILAGAIVGLTSIGDSVGFLLGVGDGTSVAALLGAGVVS